MNDASAAAMIGTRMTAMTTEQLPKEKLCADCGSWDIEWMYRCQKHKGVQYCRGCSCPYCDDESWDDYEEDGPMDLEDQLEQLLEDNPPVRREDIV
jgi:hypothetical protein